MVKVLLAPAVSLMTTPCTVVSGWSPLYWVNLMSHSGALLSPLAAAKSTLMLPVMEAVLKTQKSTSVADDRWPVIQAFSTGRFWSVVALGMAAPLVLLSPVLSTVGRMLARTVYSASLQLGALLTLTK